MNIYLRKTWHLLGLAFPALYYFGILSRFGTLVLVGGIVIGAVVLEILRFRIPAVATAFAAVFRRIMRDEEFRTLNATIPYLAATFVVILVFPRVIACAALVFLALGDAAAELVGRAVGRVRIIGPKTLEGTLACFAVCFLAGWHFLGWELALVGAGAAAVAELLSGGWVDNFSIPLAAGGAVWLASYYLHIGVRL
jgi:dolichol kinase